MWMTITMKTRCYSELSRLHTFEERFEYLSLVGQVGEATFGFDRWINQEFYRSQEWKSVRNHVIVRDSGCDLGVLDYPINGSLLVHHMNPMTSDSIIHDDSWILDPEFLITTTHDTHNAIHYGGVNSLRKRYSPRVPGDTRLW